MPDGDRLSGRSPFSYTSKLTSAMKVTVIGVAGGTGSGKSTS